jgi:hypothetical protein
VVYYSLTQSPFLGLYSAIKLKKNTTFRKPTILLPSGREAPNLVDPRDRAVTGLDIRDPLGWVPFPEGKSRASFRNVVIFLKLDGEQGQKKESASVWLLLLIEHILSQECQSAALCHKHCH